VLIRIRKPQPSSLAVRLIPNMIRDDKTVVS
jgi:hypothetical protein